MITALTEKIQAGGVLGRGKQSPGALCPLVMPWEAFSLVRPSNDESMPWYSTR